MRISESDLEKITHAVEKALNYCIYRDSMNAAFHQDEIVDSQLTRTLKDAKIRINNIKKQQNTSGFAELD